ncbi:hypothetical protein BDW59DRAFT_175917 [Aspergillus cavernicola]|uniref:Zn(2)-C6 fungal-type domain-containing protein n=1 Tax=Aspergillus cavernicola TaxID=176166 RepID=A0ABR4HKN9_9EURO
MKRKAGPEPPDAPKRHPRQDPVSCDSCRKKKLKCDRQRPCNSCLSRRLTCSFTATRVDAHRHNKAPTPGRSNTHAPQRVEAPRPTLPDLGSQNSRESLVTADWLEHIHMGDRVPAALSPNLRAELDEKPLGQSQSAGPARIILSIQQGSWTLNENPATVDLIPSLPRESDTLALFNYYCRYIGYLYHIIIPHVVEGQINEVYRSVERGSPVNPNYLALLFAITGSSLILQSSIESAHAPRCSEQFSFLTGAALTQANYTRYPTIEGLQAVVIIFHNMSNIHSCASVRGLFMIGSIIDQAKNLMLHRVDTPRLQTDAQQPNPVELETKRRLWWDIASFDWCLSFLSGPQEWTYLINPSFMQTKKPSNIDDAAIGITPAQPSTTPTHMSFFLERLKLSEVCRQIIDTIGPDQLSGKEPDYTQILALDRKIHDVQAQAPDFLRLDPSSRTKYAALYTDRPTLAWQRCLLQQAWYSRLCRLHRPFFIRGARDPTYSYSYMVGINSARKVLESKRIMDEEEPRFTPSSSAVWAIMHHVFMAAVMLLLDVCYNWDDVLGEKRKEEVLDACRMLSIAQQSSSLLKEGIDAMMSVLQRRYKTGKRGGTTAVPDVPASSSGHQMAIPAMVPAPEKLVQIGEIGHLDETQHGVENRELEDIWSEFIDNGGNMEFAAEDWTGLFNELTTVPGA